MTAVEALDAEGSEFEDLAIERNERAATLRFRERGLRQWRIRRRAGAGARIALDFGGRSGADLWR